MNLSHIFSKTKSVWLHLAAWLFVLLLNLLAIDRFEWEHQLRSQNWIIYLVIFYVNYSVLLPKLMFRKKILKYILSVILLLGLTFSGIRLLEIEGRKALLYQDLQTHSTALRNEAPISFKKRIIEKKEYDEIKRKIDKLYQWQTFNPFTRRNQQIFYPLLLIFMASTVLRLVQRWKQEEDNRVELERQRIASELEYLKQQINPHFLFNALNSIYSLSISASPDSPDAILKLSSILRYMLYETNKNKVPLNEELNVIENYIGLQKLRLTNKTKVNYSLEGDAESYYVEPLLLIPLIENAFKYGVDSSEESFITISIRILDKNLIFEAKNKIAVKQKVEESSGIGIKNIKRRLELLFPENHKFSVKTENNYFYVYMKLPLSYGKGTIISSKL